MNAHDLQQARNFTIALRQLGEGFTEQIAAMTATLALADAVLQRATAWLDRAEHDLLDSVPPPARKDG